MSATRLSPQSGVSLIEVLVAVVLTTVILTGLSGMVFTASRQTTNIAASNFRQGLMVQEVNRLSALRYADLAGQAGCRTTSTGVFPHQRCITVTSLATNRSRVTIVVRPTQPGVAADTVILERTRPPVGSPLSTN